MQERWKDVLGYDGHYKVSSYGQIATTRWGGEFHVMSPQVTKRGYYAVRLSKNGVKKGHNVHSLVAAAFLGQRPKGMEVCHGDGDRLNNHISNLRYGTRADNVRDCIKHGRWLHSKNGGHGPAILTPNQVVDIFTSSESCASLARKYKIHFTHPGKIRSGKLWASVTKPLAKKGIGDPFIYA